MLKLLRAMDKREWVMTILCAFLITGQTFFDLSLPDFMTKLTTLINTPDASISEISQIGLKMIAYALSGAVLAIGCGYLSSKVASGFSYSIRKKTFSKVMSFGQFEISKFSIASLINRTTNDAAAIQIFVAMGLQSIIRAPITAVWAVIKIIRKSWQLSAITGGFVIALLSLMFVVLKIVMPRFRHVQKQTDVVNRIARENLNGIQVVHAYNAEAYQNQKFRIENDDLINTQLFNQRRFALLVPTMNLSLNGLALSIYWVGAALINAIPSIDSAARLALFSDIIVFSAYATYVILALVLLVLVIMLAAPAEVSAERINQVLITDKGIQEGKKTEGIETGTIEFRDVSFAYSDASEDQLSHISFKINRGETIAFIGATGSGKSTLVKLAARLYDVSEGEVLVDGINIKNYTFDTLYNKVAYVTQKPVIFSGTIKENVNFGKSKSNISDEDINAALNIAQADFVSAYEDGIDHPVSQAGANLSGGQKQRLSIARAIARKAEIVLFDDSFSALDFTTDFKLREALQKNLQGTTFLIVAQRIGTIRNADKIVVLEDGKAVGIGKHEELMENCRVYHEIAMSQLSVDELKE